MHNCFMSKKSKPKLTPEQHRENQRRKSLEANRIKEMEHSDCEMELRVKGGNYGLYCQEHNKWITWLHPKELQTLSDAGIDL